MPKFIKNTLSLTLAFLMGFPYLSYSQTVIDLPKPGTMVHLSPALNPPVLKGIKVYPENPFKFDFILDQGSSDKASSVETRFIASKLIKYFLASLTTPEKDMWVNLSPSDWVKCPKKSSNSSS